MDILLLTYTDIWIYYYWHILTFGYIFWAYYNVPSRAHAKESSYLFHIFSSLLAGSSYKSMMYYLPCCTPSWERLGKVPLTMRASPQAVCILRQSQRMQASSRGLFELDARTPKLIRYRGSIICIFLKISVSCETFFSLSHNEESEFSPEQANGDSGLWDGRMLVYFGSVCLTQLNWHHTHTHTT